MVEDKGYLPGSSTDQKLNQAWNHSSILYHTALQLFNLQERQNHHNKGAISVGSDVHTFDFSFTCTTCPAKPIFVYVEACCLLLFVKVKKIVNSP